jgi:hypothetical protein
MKRHWVTKLFPALSPGEYAALKESIAANGLRESIKTWRGAVVDGVHRERACRETKVPPRYEEWDGEGSLVAYVVDLNQHRRQGERIKPSLL